MAVRGVPRAYSMSHPFRYYVRVRYGECDAQKVVFNARYAEYVDLATTEFIRAIGFADVFMAGDLDYQLVKLTIEWKAPAHYDQVLELSVATARVGTTSFTLSTVFRVAGTDPVLAIAESVNVLVDARTLHKTQIPDDLRAALEKGAPGRTTDHAGFLV